MDGNQILLLGLGIEAPWKLVDQRLDTDKQPHELHLTIKAERGSKYACPVCGEACAAHDFQEKTWRHLNFFQHHCYVVLRRFMWIPESSPPGWRSGRSWS